MPRSPPVAFLRGGPWLWPCRQEGVPRRGRGGACRRGGGSGKNIDLPEHGKGVLALSKFVGLKPLALTRKNAASSLITNCISLRGCVLLLSFPTFRKLRGATPRARSLNWPNLMVVKPGAVECCRREVRSTRLGDSSKSQWNAYLWFMLT